MPGKKVDTTLPADASPEYIAQWSTLVHCSTCDRPMRPAFTKASDWPATVAYGAGTRCKSCYNREYLDGRKASAAGQAVRRVKSRYRGQEKVRVVPVVDPAKVAEGWSPEERSAAIMVCDLAGVRHEDRESALAEAREILQMCGLFEQDRRVPLGEGLTTFRNPKGATAGSGY